MVVRTRPSPATGECWSKAIQKPGRDALKQTAQKELGQAFIDWLVSPDGQKAIADYKINGERRFFPNADDPNA
jgi:ABC-type tungstate transport system permease subunit